MNNGVRSHYSLLPTPYSLLPHSAPGVPGRWETDQLLGITSNQPRASPGAESLQPSVNPKKNGFSLIFTVSYGILRLRSKRK
ncbi:MAG: hypothetical protein F6K53_30185 [Moorea sp. SIO4A1]|uniref:hypothetical protein n=1 Tax=Moorena sp. SIO4A1 TaxID=2607835 RepID=UPI00144BFD17|nr:hypothetical protein [Moorena sp. SIO4A1]NEQ61466.1 hypothetical protein [Moorena sp. SIO4A1]